MTHRPHEPSPTMAISIIGRVPYTPPSAGGSSHTGGSAPYLLIIDNTG
jgi:hypothetical protein